MEEKCIFKKHAKLSELVKEFRSEVERSNNGRAIEIAIEINRLINKDIEDLVVNHICKNLFETGECYVHIDPIVFVANARINISTKNVESVNIVVNSPISYLINGQLDCDNSYNRSWKMAYGADDEFDTMQEKIDNFKIDGSINGVINCIKQYLNDNNKKKKRVNKVTASCNDIISDDYREFNNIPGIMMIIDLLLDLIGYTEPNGNRYTKMYNLSLIQTVDHLENGSRTACVVPNKILKQRIKIENIEVSDFLFYEMC